MVQAVSASGGMLAKVLNAARQAMLDDSHKVRGLLERDHLELSVKLLDLHAPTLCERFPAALKESSQRHELPESRVGVMSTQGLRLDQLELMDEFQVQERVEMARALQHVLIVSDSSLTEFNTYVGALTGLAHVMPERNPLRPDAYVSALHALMNTMSIPALVRMAWMRHLAGALGAALSGAYMEWSGQLQGQGVQPITYASPALATPVPGNKTMVPRVGRVVWSPEHRKTVLTLDRLRRLMAGEFEATPASPKEAFAKQFERQFEQPASASASLSGGFETTVPAAFEALQEMQQVDQVVQRMSQRPGATLGQPNEVDNAQSVREQLMGQAHGMAQTLSLEVVALMVDNLVQDTRLLEPVRHIIERMEPALLRLVLIDARFFSDRKHPARCLLQEISQRGLAFGSPEDPEFNVFLVSLQRFVSPLSAMSIDSAEPFEMALRSLNAMWTDAAARADIPSQIDSAVVALEYAEDRNLLADKMVRNLRAMPDLQRVPEGLVDFLCGPWAQVMASAQLNDRSGADDPGGYKSLVNVLLWSAQPDLTRQKIDKLTKLVPRLLSGLREGLRLIDYPSVKTSAFFDVLMKLHQQAFRPAPAKPEPVSGSGLSPSLLGSQDLWVAPSEAKASGFMAMPEDTPLPVANVAAAQPAPVAASLEHPPSGSGFGSLAVGSWVELQHQGHWIRTQLSWISPQRTMYLFTGVQGKTQSMTQRMLDRLLAAGSLRVLSDQSMVDGALDAVVQTAMFNSMDLRIE